MSAEWADVLAACKAFLKDDDWESRWQPYRALHFKMDMQRALEAVAGRISVDRSDALTRRQVEAVCDALDRVLAGDPDGLDIPMSVYQRAYDKIAGMGSRISVEVERPQFKSIDGDKS